MNVWMDIDKQTYMYVVGVSLCVGTRVVQYNTIQYA